MDNNIEYEMCPYCGHENEFHDPQDYIVKCQHCGREILLCDMCLNAEDNKYQKCDWHMVNGKSCCMRGTISA